MKLMLSVDVIRLTPSRVTITFAFIVTTDTTSTPQTSSSLGIEPRLPLAKDHGWPPYYLVATSMRTTSTDDERTTSAASKRCPGSCPLAVARLCCCRSCCPELTFSPCRERLLRSRFVVPMSDCLWPQFSARSDTDLARSQESY